MHATDEEIERFRRAGYQALEIYTQDPQTGEIIGYLFDSLRCLASGRGRREGDREVMQWEWRRGRNAVLPRRNWPTAIPLPCSLFTCLDPCSRVSSR